MKDNEDHCEEDKPTECGEGPADKDDWEDDDDEELEFFIPKKDERNDSGPRFGCQNLSVRAYMNVSRLP